MRKNCEYDIIILHLWKEEFYLHNEFDMTISDLNFDFGSTIVYNDYDKFIDKVVHAIKSL